jgi:hypothetical protein
MEDYMLGTLRQHVRGVRPISPIVKKLGEASVRPNTTPTAPPQMPAGKDHASTPPSSGL